MGKVMNMEKSSVKKYNMINIVIVTVSLLIGGLSYLLLNHLNLIIIILLVIIDYILITNNRQHFRKVVISHRHKYLNQNNFEIKLSDTPHLDSEYLQTVLPKPMTTGKSKFEHRAVATGTVEDVSYQVDSLIYNGYTDNGKTSDKKFDMTGYLIILDFADYQFCNRPLVYFNSHTDIAKYKFQQKHKLEFRRADEALVKYSKAYIHHRLIAYDGFHDKHVKNVIQAIDFNPKLFKQKFCKATIFDHSRVIYLLEESVVPDLNLEYHYTSKEVAQLEIDHKDQVDLFKKYIEQLANINDGKVKVELD